MSPVSHVRHPAPINQFFRLEYDETTRLYAKTTPWNHVHADANGRVIDWDGSLCMAAGGAVAMDVQTAGRIRLSPGQVHDHQGDNLGGIGVDDVQDAWRAYGQDLIVPADFDRQDVLIALRARRHVLIGVDYGALPYAQRVQKPGLFDHAIGLDDIDGTLVYRYDSLDTNPRWQGIEGFLDAAEALAIRVRGNRGQLFVGLTAARPALGTAAPHYAATVSHATSLFNPTTGRWTFYGAGAIKVGVRLTVRGARYTKGGRSCYPVVGTPYGGYFVPAANVKLGARVP